VPSIASFTRDGARFVNGSELDFDCVILATGYKPALNEFLEEAETVTDARGYPVPPAGESALGGLYFLGYVNPPTGLLRQIALDAQRIAERIAAQAGMRAPTASN
jgi:pyruvate/2-oxoglutarate dehydrogenase complex dihydrolipoamide dehydrogenase (E3) component